LQNRSLQRGPSGRGLSDRRRPECPHPSQLVKFPRASHLRQVVWNRSRTYSATKAAVRSFARSWTTDLKERRIRVNAISPGPIETPIIDGLWRDRRTTQRHQSPANLHGPSRAPGPAGGNRQSRGVPCLTRRQLRSVNGLVLKSTARSLLPFSAAQTG